MAKKDQKKLDIEQTQSEGREKQVSRDIQDSCAISQQRKYLANDNKSLLSNSDVWIVCFFVCLLYSVKMTSFRMYPRKGELWDTPL